MVQEITTTSWGNRIAGAFLGILIGIALIIGSFILVFWNEGNALHTAQSYEQVENTLISIPDSPIENKNNLKVVHLTGKAVTDEELTDKYFNVSDKAIKLNRNVEMYQWKQNEETKTDKQFGGSERKIKTYSYAKAWSSSLINSSKFKEADHNNPETMPIESQIEYAKDVKVGDFNLPKDLIEQIQNETPIDTSKLDFDGLTEKLKKPTKQQDSFIYAGKDPSTPEIGDLKITFSEILPQNVSIIAQQTDETLQPYVAPAGTTISLLSMGTVSSHNMIHEAEKNSAIMTALLRVLSLILMIIGFYLIMQPLVVLADVVPFIGSIIGAGTGFIAFVAGLILWTIATVLAWFTVRPLWAIGLIIIVTGVCWLLFIKKPKTEIADKTKS